MKTVEFILPDHWACAFINSDESGMDDDESEALGSFVSFMVKKYGSCHCVNVADDSNFVRYHDAADFGVLACEASTFTFAI
jgi:hypothetical protein